jgi:membrane protein implicated in regulation of membrane protease activity
MAFSPLAWLAIGIIIMACEIIVPGFIIFWFGVGGVLTALFVFTGIIGRFSAETQWLFFFLSSFAFLGLWLGVLKKRFRRPGDDSARDATLMNLRGRVTRRIVPGIPGEVELFSAFHGIRVWQAEADETIEADENISVIESSGIKLLVRKEEEKQ